MTARRAYGLAAAAAFTGALLIALGHRISKGNP